MYTAPTNTKPPQRLVEAIVAVFLFAPFGIPALLNSARVERLWYAGDHAGAANASKKAMAWSIAAWIAGPILYLAFIALFIYLYYDALAEQGPRINV